MEKIRDKAAAKKSLLARLARVEGQIRAIRRMIDEDAGCEAVAQQLAASRTALNKAFCEMIGCALEHEIGGEDRLDAPARERLNELARILTKYG